MGKMKATYAATNAKVARMRKASAAMESIDNAFLPSELAAMSDKPDDDQAIELG